MVFKLVAKFARGVERIVLHHDRAQTQHRVKSDHMLRAIWQDQRHPVSGFHTEFAQPLGCLQNLFA